MTDTAFLPVTRSDRLTDIAGIRHGVFGRGGGVSEGLYDSLNVGVGSDDAPEAVAENRARVASAIGARNANHLLSTYQIHSSDVITVKRKWPMTTDGRPRADAMVTDRRGLALCIVTADCVPVLFADTKNGIIGAAHAGWKGALGTDGHGILEATMQAMIDLGAHPKHIRCAIGPCIHQDSYEVGPEYRDRFLQDAPWSANLFNPGAGDHWHFNLPIFVKNRLTRLKPAWIDLIEHDTCALPDTYFSNRYRNHHGQPDYGRNASVIMLPG